MDSVVAWLLSFKGPNGMLARLESLYSELEALEAEPARLPGGMGGGGGRGVSDPTARDAAALIRRKERIEGDAAECEAQLSLLADALGACPHGDVVGDYYLDASGNITWLILANDAGVNERTVQRWRDETVERLSRMPGIPPMS